MATKKKATPVNGWDPKWLLANAPTGTYIPNAGIATGPAPTGQTPAVNPLADAAYNNSTGDADTAYGNQIANDTYGETRTANDYGFTLARGGDGTVDYDATIAGGVDPSNPFSKMALLSRAYQQQQGQTTNSYAAMGQLYSSAIGDQRGADTFNNDQQNDATKKAFQDAIQGYTSDRSGAKATQNSAYSTAAWNRLQAQTGGS